MRLPMRKTLPDLCAFLGTFLAAACAVAQPPEIRFAPMPLESPEIMASQWKAVIEHLEKRLGQRVRIVYQPTNQAIVEKLRAGEIDLAHLGPLPYVVLKEQMPEIEPVVHVREPDGSLSYTCAIVAIDERKLKPGQIRNMKVALTQPLSTCGYLVTEGLMRQAGTTLEANRYRYLNRHDAVALAVARGDYDVGGLRTGIGMKYAHLGLVVLAESAPQPAFALVANAARLSPQTVASIREALTAADPAVRSTWGETIRQGFAPAHDMDYTPVRKLRGKTPIPLQGNF